jgi:hypothetical protein
MSSMVAYLTYSKAVRYGNLASLEILVVSVLHKLHAYT